MKITIQTKPKKTRPTLYSPIDSRSERFFSDIRSRERAQDAQWRQVSSRMIRNKIIAVIA